MSHGEEVYSRLEALLKRWRTQAQAERLAAAKAPTIGAAMGALTNAATLDLFAGQLATALGIQTGEPK